ncbi:MAG: glycogen synthase GlgA [Oxalobacteraceae bacterium]|nr:glycogen synthase GlgA [Oxalobacteraceae bacterium]
MRDLASAQNSGPIHVLQVSSELFPWLKTGGLADVTGALPWALAPYGIEVRPLVPGLPVFLKAVTDRRLVASAVTPWGDALEINCVQLESSRFGRAYLIVAPQLYERGGTPYEGEDKQAFGDNHRRFAALSWAAKLLSEGLDPEWAVSLVHAHDWHAGLAPLYMKVYRSTGLPQIPCLFTIHNLAYQGLFASKHLGELAIPQSCWHMDAVEFHGQISMLKAGIAYADSITTVSPRYAREILEPDQGQGLHGFLRGHVSRLSGVLNGIDTNTWNPTQDPFIEKSYQATNLAAKEQNVSALQSRLGLEPRTTGPRCAVISRLTEQKGLGLIVQAAEIMMQDGAQLVVLGSGDEVLERQFDSLQCRYPGKVSFRSGFDEQMAHQMIAGSDVILVPSRFEPCGLTQMYGLRYGCLPLVHLVGGLADTIKPWRLKEEAVVRHEDTPNGFGFDRHSLDSFLTCWRHMLICWNDRPAWQKLQEHGMSLALSWEVAAANYASLYDRMISYDVHED